MNYKDLTPAELMHKLNTAGRYPHSVLVNTIWEQQAKTEPLLLAIFNEAFDDDWPNDDDPRWYRFVHAGKFLLAWQNTDAMPMFARLYATDDNAKQNWCEWFEEDLFHFGPPIIPYLQPIISKDSDNIWDYGKALSGSILTKIATYYPETRAEVTTIFQAQLPSLDAIPATYDDMWGSWATELGELADAASRDHILALADAGVFIWDYFDRQSYLRDINRGFKPQKPPHPYDIRTDYQHSYEWEQQRKKRVARERELQRSQRIRAVKPRTEPKVGRNAPCPCGSGNKYKKCHGRPGA